jgi:tetratricopeptide (TPR) repeat protein
MAASMLLVLTLAAAMGGGEVRMSEEKIVLPTYETEEPDKIPLFYRPEEVQLAEKHVYPYPFYDVKSTEKKDREYTAVILENEYLKICVTPEMGGRLYYALDKTNGYDLVYNNRVVKPALIGTIGAWTSGGVEWNTPHHHRATSLIQVDHILVDNPDGSKTVWVGEYEKRCRTRWLTGMTLEPGKAFVKIEFKSINPTPLEYPALFFANAAVHVNDTYQFIFPPDVEMMNFHYVSEFTRWPVPNQVYQSTDYTHGEDLSWWREARQPVSFFVTKTRQDFMGGIDHGKKAGTVLIGDHRIFKGKKLWNWGKNEVQAVWDQKLTDSDGPYAELMMGFYSDNQPDYNFVAPFETKYGTMYLCGLRGMDGIREADRDFALNLDLRDGAALIQVNATAVRKGVGIVLTRAGRTVFEDTTDLSPAAAYEKTVTLGADATLEELRLSLRPTEGGGLMAWQKQPPLNEPFPETHKDPLDPKEYKTAQELYFAGLKIEQFGNTNYDYMKYYGAALALEPDHVAANTQTGLVFLKRGEYAKAEEHLGRAADVVTGNHKKAQDATPLFYLGVCLMKQGRTSEALDLLHRAAWDYPWTSAGCTLAARLEGARGDWRRALDAAERACAANTMNVEAQWGRAVALRLLGARDKAADAAGRALAVDPLCFAAMNEMRLLSGGTPTGRTAGEWAAMLGETLRGEPYNHIETASRYAEFGLFGEAAEVLEMAVGSGDPALNSHPMIYYHLGMCLAAAGREKEADQALEKAASLPTDLCFPYGDDSVRALQFALARNDRDANAHYLLGNALADHQHQAAVDSWKKAAELAPDRAIIHRNIAYLQANHLRDMPGALDNIMRAISLDHSEPRYFSEARLYMSYASLTPAQLAEFLANYGKLAGEITDIQLMEVDLAVFNGEYDRAIALLERMNYHIREGATFNPHVHWFDAHLHRGITLMNGGDHAGAEKSMLRAMEFPANLEAERDSKTGIAWYHLGVNAAKAGDAGKAREYFEKMRDYTFSQGWGAGDFPEIEYYRALALSELGADPAEVEKLFRKLITDGENRLATVRDGRHITVSVDESHSARTFLLEHELGRKGLLVSSLHMRALGHLGLGDREKAREFLLKALEADPMALDSKLMLESIGG